MSGPVPTSPAPLSAPFLDPLCNTRKPVVVMPNHPSTISRREALYARAAALRDEQRDLVPDTAAYKAKTVSIDAVLTELFRLGPRDQWGDPD
jgi:hypothetical protein